MSAAWVPISAADGVGPGHVCLVGAGEYLEPMVAVDLELLGLTPAAREGRTPKVVCLPTAAGTEGAAVVDRWMTMGVEHFRRLGADATALRVVDRASAGDEWLEERIGTADLVYVSGGKPEHLLDSLAGTPTWRGVLACLAAGGVVAGCSAGAMIMGSLIVGFPNVTRRRPGFALVPGAVVLPHFDEYFARLGSLARFGLPADSYVLGVDGMTGLLVGRDGWRVLGERRVVIETRGRRAELVAGDRG